MSFTSGTLGHAKAASLVVMTKELAAFSNPAAEALVRDDMMAATRYAYVMLRHAICPPDPTPALAHRKPYDWRAG